VIETMTLIGNFIQASMEVAINPISILGKAINLEFNHGVRTNYLSLPNNRLKLTAHMAKFMRARSLA
jgi:hypothetical protein